jgi:hypothetical protein
VNSRFIPPIAGILFAFLLSFSQPGAFGYFHLQMDYGHRTQETEKIRETIKLFNGMVGGFYATGFTAGLKEFPAENPVRRRIFQDLRNWEQSGLFYVMDRDKTVIKGVRIVTPDLAIAVADENWFNVFQDLRTRRQVSTKKANLITVRYYLRKKWGRWIVFEYEVYPQGDRLPSLAEERVLSWR